MSILKSTPHLALAALVGALFSTAVAAHGSTDIFREQATEVVKPLRFADNAKTDRAILLTANYLRQIAVVTSQRQADLEASGHGGEDAPEVNHQTAAAWQICRDTTVPLRDAYVAQLDAIMTPAQVERVKDGLTGDSFHSELQRFDRMVPDLLYPERAHIVGLLDEMRENALLEIEPKLQNQWVHKYRGIINNYLAARGHDFHALAKAYKETYETPKP